MGRIVFDTATSLNGWIADEHNSLAWLFAESDILAHPQKWREFHGDKPTFVFTTRQLPVPEGADVRFVSGPVADVLPVIRETAGDGDIWVLGDGDAVGAAVSLGAGGEDHHVSYVLSQ